jgi:hypothetical protein
MRNFCIPVSGSSFNYYGSVPPFLWQNGETFKNFFTEIPCLGWNWKHTHTLLRKTFELGVKPVPDLIVPHKNVPYLQIIISILKVTDEKSKIRIRKSVALIRGSGSVLRCHGSTTLPLANDLWLVNSNRGYRQASNIHNKEILAKGVFRDLDPAPLMALTKLVNTTDVQRCRYSPWITTRTEVKCWIRVRF